MADGRRRQWLAMDPGYYSNALTVKLFARFGNAGVIVFDAFIRACKHSFVEGQMSYANTDQFLNMLGLPPTFELVDNVGDKWDLDDLWKMLGEHHMTSRRRRDGRTTITARRWDEWQKRRSKPKNAEAESRLTTTSTTTKTPLPPAVDEPVTDEDLERLMYGDEVAAKRRELRAQ